MPARLIAVTYDAREPALVGAFWAALLERSLVEEPDGVLLPGDDTQVGLRFVASESPRTGADRFHLHLTSETDADQAATVARALELGASRRDVGQEADAPFVVLADPGGNELCVIEAGNTFLAGCGRLGEVTCDGTRDVGLFWHEVLGWPLVWDQHEETAIQSPAGGTKISWGGPPVAVPQGANRQRFALVGSASEVERLGARRLREHAYADPDGNEFTLVPG